MKNIVLNIPHSSINGLFEPQYGRWSGNPSFINDCVIKWTDWYTDYLFSVENASVRSVIFPYSRFVCDAERLENDEMEKIGQGIAYTSFDSHKRVLNEEEKANVYELWKEHQKRLAENIDANTVVIDCHSFPGNKDDVDICIGYNDDWSYDKRIVDIIQQEFEKIGYSVGLNTPYSNSITPKTECKYKSVMIEVNKRIYMDDLKLREDPHLWTKWFETIPRIYDKIIDLE